MNSSVEYQGEQFRTAIHHTKDLQQTTLVKLELLETKIKKKTSFGWLISVKCILTVYICHTLRHLKSSNDLNLAAANINDMRRKKNNQTTAPNPHLKIKKSSKLQKLDKVRPKPAYNSNSFALLNNLSASSSLIDSIFNQIILEFEGND